jgi:hypothetical protein
MPCRSKPGSRTNPAFRNTTARSAPTPDILEHEQMRECSLAEIEKQQRSAQRAKDRKRRRCDRELR